MNGKSWTIVTGATGGIGTAIVRSLLRQGCPVVMACRNIRKANILRDQLIAEFPDGLMEVMALDLAELASIRAFVSDLVSSGRPVNALINNAGVMCKHFERTVDGLEKTVGVNAVGTYVLSRLLASVWSDAMGHDEAIDRENRENRESPLRVSSLKNEFDRLSDAASPMPMGEKVLPVIETDPKTKTEEEVCQHIDATHSFRVDSCKGIDTGGSRNSDSLRTHVSDWPKKESGKKESETCSVSDSDQRSVVEQTDRKDKSEKFVHQDQTPIGMEASVMQRSSEPVYRNRIVNVVSCTARIGKTDVSMLFGDGATYHRMEAYSRSKRALMILTAELSRRLQVQGIAVVAADPGVVDTGMISMQRWYDPLTDLFFRPFIKSPERGAEPVLSAWSGSCNMTGELFRGHHHAPIPLRYGNDRMIDRLVAEIERIADLEERVR